MKIHLTSSRMPNPEDNCGSGHSTVPGAKYYGVPKVKWPRNRRGELSQGPRSCWFLLGRGGSKTQGSGLSNWGPQTLSSQLGFREGRKICNAAVKLLFLHLCLLTLAPQATYNLGLQIPKEGHSNTHHETNDSTSNNLPIGKNQ